MGNKRRWLWEIRSSDRPIKPTKRLILFLTTYGGSQIRRIVLRDTRRISLKILYCLLQVRAKARTLLALGASKIYMSPFGEFGPLDVQVFKADEIFERRSAFK